MQSLILMKVYIGRNFLFLEKFKKNFPPLLYPGACIIYQLEKTHTVDRTFASVSVFHLVGRFDESHYLLHCRRIDIA